ncbi:MAG: hypothetical protein IPN29_13930 [Saprospiraceae bacterium]|nr:hypothetical protein [Saprospiraceae bacterium]
MKTGFYFRLLALALMMFTFVQQDAVAQRGRNRGMEGMDLTEAQRGELKKLREERFLENHRMQDRMKADRMEMRQRHDKQLRSILTEKQYYAFKDKAKGKKRMHASKGRGGHPNGGMKGNGRRRAF